MQRAISLHQIQRTRARRHAFGGVRFLLPALLALLLGALAYQLPSRTTIDVGELGDQLFLSSSEAQRAEQIERGKWYADQLSPEGRSRWSRERGTIRLPGLGHGQDVQLTLHMAGWPSDVVRAAPKQPEVQILVGGQAVGVVTPSSDVAAYTVSIPAALQATGPLTTTLQVTPTFTDTAVQVDARPKGIRLDAIEVVTRGRGVQPDWLVLGGLVLATVLTTGVAASGSQRGWLVGLASMSVALFGASAIFVARPWLAALLPGVLVALAMLFALVNVGWLARQLAAIRWRMSESRPVDFGLVAAVLLICLYLAARPLLDQDLPTIEPFQRDGAERFFRVVMWLSLAGTVLLALLSSVTLLPQWLLTLRRALLTRRLAAMLLGLLAGVWLGYLTWLMSTLPFVGHADYADNAVVARNLLRGRGYVVDYVTQFYRLIPGGSVTRPQETWPLLQPLLMLPTMALLGPTPFAVRLPNLLFLVTLTLLIYHIGARLWDRRVGLLAAILTLTNVLFFRLAIYATSDLALVVWSMAAFWLVYQAVEQRVENKERASQASSGIRPFLSNRWAWAGLFSGLMILQKPSSAILVFGMGLWVLGWTYARSAGEDRIARLRSWSARWVRPLLTWTALTILVVTPYLVRNLLVFGRPFFSTEAYDAWILYFRGTRGEAWEDIYKIYTPELGGPGLPERSWILRWGYDLTLGKVAQQARDAWQFFAPPKGVLLSTGNRDEFPHGVLGTWLMLLGLVTLRRRPRALIGLIAAALVPYILFLVVYWHTHDEPRYFVPFVPWLALLSAWGACWLFDRIAAIDRGRWAGLGGLLVSLSLLLTVAPHWYQIDRFLDPQSSSYWGKDWAADLEAYRWLRENTPPDAVVMTRVPWQLNFHADRGAVMIPNAGAPEIMRIARYYGADYLLVNGSTTSLPESVGALKPLAQGNPGEGWVLEYTAHDQFQGADVYVYRFPENYAGVEDIQVESK